MTSKPKLQSADGGSSTSKSYDAVMSMDTGDVAKMEKEILLDGGLGTLISGNAAARGLQSSEFVKDMLLPSKMVRNSTGDDLVPLSMNFRVSSGNWVKEYKAEEAEAANMLALDPNIATTTKNHDEHQSPLKDSGRQPLTSLQLPLGDMRLSSADWLPDFQDEVDTVPFNPTLFVASSMPARLSTSPPPLPPLPPPGGESNEMSSRSKHTYKPSTNKKKRPTKTSKSSSATNKHRMNTQKSRARLLDERIAIEPTDNDVLCGRGGFTNSHPGNIRFRKKALELRSWYEQSSKEEKQNIADILVESVLNEGRRFLGKGKDGLWHEMVGNGPHYKASQALRERLRR